MEIIAHRAGNTPQALVDVITHRTAVDAVELDVHLFRGRLEVRHAKLVCRPFGRLWERWQLLPADAPRPSLESVVPEVPDGVGLWIDLKGFSRRLPARVHAVVGARSGTTYSSRQWWLVAWVRRHTSARAFASVGSRWQRWCAVHLGVPADGIVVADRLVVDGWLERLLQRVPTVVVWGVADRDRAADLARRGVRGFILDDVSVGGFQSR
ncbi:MAG: hypothetical protein ACO23O_05460 [Ilumatobacteraceae bacterium]